MARSPAIAPSSRGSQERAISGHFAGADGAFRLVSRNGDAVAAVTAPPAIFEAGAPLLLVFAWDESDLYLSVDGGEYVSAGRSDAVPDLTSAETLEIGARGGAEEMNGRFGPVYLYDRVITPGQVGSIRASQPFEP